MTRRGAFRLLGPLLLLATAAGRASQGVDATRGGATAMPPAAARGGFAAPPFLSRRLAPLPGADSPRTKSYSRGHGGPALARAPPAAVVPGRPSTALGTWSQDDTMTTASGLPPTPGPRSLWGALRRIGFRRSELRPHGDGPSLLTSGGGRLGVSSAGEGDLSVVPAGGAQKPKKVLLLMSDTGGGHKASAQAIAAALQELYPRRFECEIVDIWTDYGTWPFNRAVPSYQFLAKHPLLWKITYEYGRFPPTQWLTQRICAMKCWSGIKRCLQEKEPDLVISVHPLCQHLPLRIANHLHGSPEERKAKMPFVTVVTDLGGGHPLWFHHKIDRTFVPSDACERLARRRGVPEEKLRKHGLPIRPGFGRLLSRKERLRKQLGLKQGVRTALVVGGGDGVGRIGRIAKALADELGADGGGPAQLAVVCGKNDALRDQLLAEPWPANVHVSVQGFVRNMDEWMAASDCIITKAGPGTIAEACASGIPIMLSAYLPGQEAANVPFVVKGGFGAYSTRPAVIAKTVSGWLRDPQKLDLMSQNARDAGRPEAVRGIARDIGELAFPQG